MQQMMRLGMDMLSVQVLGGQLGNDSQLGIYVALRRSRPDVESYMTMSEIVQRMYKVR